MFVAAKTQAARYITILWYWKHAGAKLSRDTEGGWRAGLDPPRLTDKAGALAVWVEVKGIPVQAAGGWLVVRSGQSSGK